MGTGSIESGLSRITAPGMGDTTGELTSRHSGVPGFDQAALERANIALIGAGGLGGEIGAGLVRKGLKRLAIFDGDTVELSNLPRQRFFPKDVWRNKAVALAGNLVPEAINRAELIAAPMHFQVALKRGLIKNPDLAICGVDNNPARVSVARYCACLGIPAVFVAVSRDADHGYVFVQRPGEACFGCLFPDAVDDKTTPCPNTPAVKDILLTVSGIVLFAIDTLLMKRQRQWNYKTVFLSSNSGQAMNVPRRTGCHICGPENRSDDGRNG